MNLSFLQAHWGRGNCVGAWYLEEIRQVRICLSLHSLAEWHLVILVMSNGVESLKPFEAEGQLTKGVVNIICSTYHAISQQSPVVIVETADIRYPVD